MRIATDQHSDHLVHETLCFTQHALHGSAGLFYWIDAEARMRVAHTGGMPQGLLERYFAGMDEFDPMHVRRMIASGSRVGVLGDAESHWPAHQMARYREFLDAYDVTDTVDLLLWDARGAFAGIGILKRRDDPPLSASNMNLASLRRYIEISLRTHARVRSSHIEAMLSGNYRLTRREREVATLLYGGASNAQIAGAMGIGLATVKTHVISIFDKIGVSSRTALIAYLTQLMLS